MDRSFPKYENITKKFPVDKFHELLLCRHDSIAGRIFKMVSYRILHRIPQALK